MIDDNNEYLLKNQKDEKSLLFGFAIFLVIVGIIVMVTFYCNMGSHYSIAPESKKPSMDVTGQIGDFVGGVVGTMFSLVGVLLLFVTLKDQRESFKRERFETRFFEMIKLHRDNVSEMSYTYFKGKTSSGESKLTEHTAESRKVFKIIFSDFETLAREVEHFFVKFGIEDIYVLKYLNQLKKNSTLVDRKINLLDYAKVDIIYTIIFFGLSKSGTETIRQYFKDRYSSQFFESLLKYCSLKPKEESDLWHVWFRYNIKNFERKSEILQRWLKSLKDGLKSSDKNLFGDGHDFYEYKDIFQGNNFTKYYGGHQFRLGHYFRHFYQTVTYIDSSILFDYNEKYENVKLLRGQLSTYEQLIIFINSISILGRVWELEKRNEPSDKIETNSQLITKYNLIKNISSDVIFDNVLASKFYPLVSYEANPDNQIQAKRALIENIYK